MAVVINEFEVVTDEAPPPAASAPAAEQVQATPPEAGEIQRIARFLEERARRVWAH